MAMSFHTIFENKDAKALPDWIQQAINSCIAALKNFATGLESDYAAITYHWSNGQVEEQVNRLKVIKSEEGIVSPKHAPDQECLKVCCMERQKGIHQ